MSKIEIQKSIDDLISSNKVVIFSKSYCPYCKQTKSCFVAIGAQFEVLELDELDNARMNTYQDILLDMTGARSVPRVFINGKSIGGASDTEKLQKQEKLKALIEG